MLAIIYVMRDIPHLTNSILCSRERYILPFLLNAKSTGIVAVIYSWSNLVVVYYNNSAVNI